MQVKEAIIRQNKRLTKRYFKPINSQQSSISVKKKKKGLVSTAAKVLEDHKDNFKWMISEFFHWWRKPPSQHFKSLQYNCLQLNIYKKACSVVEEDPSDVLNQNDGREEYGLHNLWNRVESVLCHGNVQLPMHLLIMHLLTEVAQWIV